jgi:hypothetical protein
MARRRLLMKARRLVCAPSECRTEHATLSEISFVRDGVGLPDHDAAARRTIRSALLLVAIALGLVVNMTFVIVSRAARFCRDPGRQA